MNEIYDFTIITNKTKYLSYITNNETINDLINKLINETNNTINNIQFKVLLDTNNLLSSPSSLLLPPNSNNNINTNQLITFNNILEEFRYPWLSTFFLSINTIILHLRPTMTVLLNQKNILDHIVKILYKCLGTIAFPTGVTITHVLLPDEKIDMTVFLPNPVDHKWQLKFHEALIPESSSDPSPQLQSIQFHNKDKSTSLSFGDVKVHISVNDISALYNSALYEDLDGVFNSDGLMKNSYLLIKSWIINDSDDNPDNKILPNLINGKLLQVMIMYLFCHYGHVISHPFVALTLFLHLFSTMDYETTIIDIENALDIFNDMILNDPSLEIKYQFRNQSTATSVQSLIASCVGNEFSTLQGVEGLTSSNNSVGSGVEIGDFPEDDPQQQQQQQQRLKQNNQNTPRVLIDKIKYLINDYRSRYEATLIANNRVSEEDSNLELSLTSSSNDNTPREISQLQFLEDPYSGISKLKPTKLFHKSYMNVADPICNYINLADHIVAADVQYIRSIFTLGLQKILFHLNKYNSYFLDKSSTDSMDSSNKFENPPSSPSFISSSSNSPLNVPANNNNTNNTNTNNNNTLNINISSPPPPTTTTTTTTNTNTTISNTVNVVLPNPPSLSTSLDPSDKFISSILSKTKQISIKQKNQAVTVNDLAYLEQLKKNPCSRDNAIVSPPEILLKQGEFILMGIQNASGQLQITPTAVANLIVQCLEKFGPQLVGDIGKQLQDLTGIPNLPKILKAKYRGLKKVIEAFPQLFLIGSDHIINPTIYLKDSRRPSQGQIIPVGLEHNLNDPHSIIHDTNPATTRGSLNEYSNYNLSSSLSSSSNASLSSTVSQYSLNRNPVPVNPTIPSNPQSSIPQMYSQYSTRTNLDSSMNNNNNNNLHNNNNNNNMNNNNNNNNNNNKWLSSATSSSSSNTSRSGDNYYSRSNVGTNTSHINYGYGGGNNINNLNNNRHDRSTHRENEEYYDYYDQYNNNYGQQNNSRLGAQMQSYQNHSSYTTNRDPRNQTYGNTNTTRNTQLHSRPTTTEHYLSQPEYEYESRWNQQDISRSKLRDNYGTVESAVYNSDRAPVRDSRYTSLQSWGSYPEYDNTNTQRTNSNYYSTSTAVSSTSSSRSDLRVIGRPSDDYEFEEFRRSQEFDNSIRPPIRSNQPHGAQDKKSSGWLDFDNIIASDNHNIGHYRSGHEAGSMDHNF